MPTAGRTGDADKGRLSERWEVTSARVCLPLMWQVPRPIHSGLECILVTSFLRALAGWPADKGQPFRTEAGSESALPHPAPAATRLPESLSARAPWENSGHAPFFELKSLEAQITDRLPRWNSAQGWDTTLQGQACPACL